MITSEDLNEALIKELPELADDLVAYDQRRSEDPEFMQSFFSYSFIPTLQVAIDQNIEDFCQRAFALIERLLTEGDTNVQVILREEFFDYGPACEKWMKRAGHHMGRMTRAAAQH